MVLRCRSQLFPGEVIDSVHFVVDLITRAEWNPSHPPKVIAHASERKAEEQAHRNNHALQQQWKWRTILLEHPRKQRDCNRNAEEQALVRTTASQHCHAQSHQHRIANSHVALDSWQCSQ